MSKIDQKGTKYFGAIIIAFILLIALSVGGVYCYNTYYKKDDNNNNGNNTAQAKTITNFDDCKKENGTLTGEFKEVCTYESKNYTRELTNEEKLTKIKTFDDCKTNNGTITETIKCIIYGKEFIKDLSYINLVIPSALANSINKDLEQEIREAISRIGGENYRYIVSNHRQQETWGDISIKVEFTEEEAKQLGLEIINGYYESEAGYLRLFYLKDNNQNYKLKIQHEDGVNNILDGIPGNTEIERNIKSDYREDSTKFNQLLKSFEEWLK